METMFSIVRSKFMLYHIIFLCKHLPYFNRYFVFYIFKRFTTFIIKFSCLESFNVCLV